jgi:acetyltransferase-like isoleucine patch superfamily enzyme
VHYLKSYLIDPRFHIGRFSYSDGDINVISDMADLYIGKYCSIAKDVTIFLGENHRVDWITTYPFPMVQDRWKGAKDLTGNASTKGDVVIGNDVWIGTGATIMSGVTIGDGAVIGAKTVVSKDVPPYSVVVGNSGRIAKYRFDEKTIKRLLEMKWWDWPVEKIDENIPILCSPNVKDLNV